MSELGNTIGKFVEMLPDVPDDEKVGIVERALMNFPFDMYADLMKTVDTDIIDALFWGMAEAGRIPDLKMVHVLKPEKQRGTNLTGPT